MAERPSSKSSAEWRLELPPEPVSGVKTITPDVAPLSFEDITKITGPASTKYDGTFEKTPVSVGGSVQMAAVSVVTPKMTSVVDIFNGLHPEVKRDLVNVNDLANSPGEFNGVFRELCLTNPLLLQQASNMFFEREVKAKITMTGGPDDGWCVAEKLEEIVGPDTYGEIELRAVKTSGDFSVYPKGTIKAIPLRNIIPFNLTR